MECEHNVVHINNKSHLDYGRKCLICNEKDYDPPNNTEVVMFIDRSYDQVEKYYKKRNTKIRGLTGDLFGEKITIQNEK